MSSRLRASRRVSACRALRPNASRTRPDRRLDAGDEAGRPAEPVVGDGAVGADHLEERDGARCRGRSTGTTVEVGCVTPMRWATSATRCGPISCVSRAVTAFFEKASASARVPLAEISRRTGATSSPSPSSTLGAAALDLVRRRVAALERARVDERLERGARLPERHARVVVLVDAKVAAADVGRAPTRWRDRSATSAASTRVVTARAESITARLSRTAARASSSLMPLSRARA